jgi:transketolase
MGWEIGDRIDPRIAYGDALIHLGHKYNNIVVMDADLQRSNRTFGFGQLFPDRFIDMGIAEADMISTAAGMASMGFVVFATSFAMFLPGRCYDQIRLQIAYAKSNVKLVGTSAGLTIGPDGASHQSLDDIALMRQLPGMTVIVPADATETYQAVLQAAEIDGPVYIRVSRYPTPVLYGDGYVFKLGTSDLIVEGDDIVIFASGIMVDKAMRAADILHEINIHASVVNLSTIKPIDNKEIITFCAGKKLVITLEEHNVIGGVGSAISEVLAEFPNSPLLSRIGMNDCFGQSGSAEDLLDYYDLTPPKIASTITKTWFSVIRPL